MGEEGADLWSAERNTVYFVPVSSTLHFKACGSVQVQRLGGGGCEVGAFPDSKRVSH